MNILIRNAKKVRIRANFFLYKTNREKYLQYKCKKKLGYKINLENPQTYNEKIQWLKLYWYDERAKKCVDKYEVRHYIKEKGYENLLNELYGVYDSFDEIDFKKLPEQYVLKVTHNSGGVVVVDKKHPLNMEKAKQKINLAMSNDYFVQSQEWVYKDMRPRIICEEYIESEDGEQAKDYKFFCSNGKVQFLFVASDRGYINGRPTTKFDFYTPDWKLLPVQQGYPTSGKVLPVPQNLSKMIEIAEDLSKDFPHVRVDFYNEFEKIIFGELTFFHFSGTKKFNPAEYDKTFGQYIDLSNIKKKVYADEQ